VSVDAQVQPSTTWLGRVAGGWTGPAGRERLRNGGIVVPFLALFLTLSLASEPFATKDNLLNILDQQAATLIIAAAGTLVLVAGGIDLSVGATWSFAGVTAMHFAQTENATMSILIGIAAGVVVGLANGIVVTVLRVNSLITTLASSFVVGGIASLVTGGNLLYLPEGHPFGDLTRPTFLGVKLSIWLVLGAVVVLGIVLAWTTAGRYMYAAGGSAAAARLAGVRVDAIRILTFVLSGAAAGLAGVVDASRTLSAQASTGDVSLTFTVLAGIVVGGTSILGGDGAVWRSALGVLFIALIGNGYELLGYNVLYEQITTGAILILAVALDVWLRQRRA
jgi:ribose transport system permease protein